MRPARSSAPTHTRLHVGHAHTHAPPRINMRRYGRLDEPATGDGAGDDASAAEASQRRRAALLERVANKIHAAFWVALASVVAYYGDVLGVATNPGRSNS